VGKNISRPFGVRDMHCSPDSSHRFAGECLESCSSQQRARRVLLLILLGISAPQAVLVLCIVVMLLAIGLMIEFLDKCR
jgi:hypothetical protein